MGNSALHAERSAADSKVTVLLASAATDKRRRWGQRLRPGFAISEVAERTALAKKGNGTRPGRDSRLNLSGAAAATS